MTRSKLGKFHRNTVKDIIDLNHILPYTPLSHLKRIRGSLPILVKSCKLISAFRGFLTFSDNVVNELNIRRDRKIKTWKASGNFLSLQCELGHKFMKPKRIFMHKLRNKKHMDVKSLHKFLFPYLHTGTQSSTNGSVKQQ